MLFFAAAALALGAGAGPAFAISGESELTVPLSALDCPSEGDVLIACFDGGVDSAFRCDLFGVATGTADDTLPMTLCANRSVIADPELFPETGPIEEGITLEGTSHGYIRALALQGVTDPVHAVTATFGTDAESVKIEPATDNGTVQACDFQPKFEMPKGMTERTDFCAAVAGALPIVDPAGVDLRFVLEVDYKDESEDESEASNFGEADLMTLWACPGLTAQCFKGSPAQFDDVAGGGAVLDEIYIRFGLSNSYTRYVR